MVALTVHSTQLSVIEPRSFALHVMIDQRWVHTRSFRGRNDKPVWPLKHVFANTHNNLHGKRRNTTPPPPFRPRNGWNWSCRHVAVVELLWFVWFLAVVRLLPSFSSCLLWLAFVHCMDCWPMASARKQQALGLRLSVLSDSSHVILKLPFGSNSKCISASNRGGLSAISQNCQWVENSELQPSELGITCEITVSICRLSPPLSTNPHHKQGFSYYLVFCFLFVGNARVDISLVFKDRYISNHS